MSVFNKCFSRTTQEGLVDYAEDTSREESGAISTTIYRIILTAIMGSDHTGLLILGVLSDIGSISA